jgi:hypothetical protein
MEHLTRQAVRRCVHATAWWRTHERKCKVYQALPAEDYRRQVIRMIDPDEGAKCKQQRDLRRVEAVAVPADTASLRGWHLTLAGKPCRFGRGSRPN